jgi:hypothetical protein
MPWPIVAPSPLSGKSKPIRSTPSLVLAGSVVVVVLDGATLVAAESSSSVQAKGIVSATATAGPASRHRRTDRRPGIDPR